MQADAALTTNGDTSETSVDILRTSADGQSITRLTRDGLSLYLANDTLYLADGSACALGANGLIDKYENFDTIKAKITERAKQNKETEIIFYDVSGLRERKSSSTPSSRTIRLILLLLLIFTRLSGKAA